MEDFVFNFWTRVIELWTQLPIILQNVNPLHAAITVGVIIFVVGVWFFSDGLDNLSNATSFIFSFGVLCLLGYLAYQLVGIFQKSL